MTKSPMTPMALCDDCIGMGSQFLMHAGQKLWAPCFRCDGCGTIIALSLTDERNVRCPARPLAAHLIVSAAMIKGKNRAARVSPKETP